MEKIITHLDNYLKDRPTMEENNSDPQRVFELLMGEIAELNEAILTGHLIAPEMADVAIFLITLASNFDINLEKEIMTKIGRNMAKYPASEFQEGDYTEARLKCQRDWINLGGDNAFYSD